MHWLNLNHLQYFWTVAREKTIARACEVLHLAQPTISAQIRALERSLGHKLLVRNGRYLELTEMGKIVFRYADEIFSISRELVDTVQGGRHGQSKRLIAGVVDVLPKFVAQRLLEPALKLQEPVQLICREDNLESLLTSLANNEVDIILSDSPVTSAMKIRAFNHLLGETTVSVVGTSPLVKKFKKNFPESLDQAPFLLPDRHSSLRRDLDHWFDLINIRPVVRGEFEDSALLKVFGQAGEGLFVVPRILQPQICRQYDVELVGHIDSIRERYFAISGERKIRHPAVAAISESAKRDLFIPFPA